MHKARGTEGEERACNAWCQGNIHVDVIFGTAADTVETLWPRLYPPPAGVTPLALVPAPEAPPATECYPVNVFWTPDDCQAFRLTYHSE